MFDPQPLDDATLARVRQTQSHRYPQRATLRPPVPGGTVEIPIVLGNPSGACTMPPGSIVSPAWAQYVFPALSNAPDPKGLAELMARDMAIWPDALAVDEILSMWPALSQVIAVRLMPHKIGRFTVSDPQPTEAPPEYVADALSAHPRGVWRWVRPAKADAFTLVIQPPDAMAFTVFNDEMREPSADHWKIVRAFVDTVVPAVFDPKGLPVSLDPVIARYPGAALSLAKDAAFLGGMAASAELGE